LTQWVKIVYYEIKSSQIDNIEIETDSRSYRNKIIDLVSIGVDFFINKAVRLLNWLVECFIPISGWDEKKIKELKKNEK